MTLKLVWKNIWSHKLRSLMTVGAVGLAVFLVCILQAIVSALESATDNASTKRLWVQSAVSLYVDLPLNYEGKIASIDGIEHTSRWQWFGGEYKDAEGFFAQFAVDQDSFMASYPEMKIIDGSYEDFVENRSGCVIGKGLVDQYGWKVGDRVPIVGRIFSKADGSAWEFDVEAVYEATSTALDENTLFFQFDLLKESIEQGAVAGMTDPASGVYLVDLEDGASATAVSAQIDRLFENGPQRVQTTTEAEFSRQFVDMLGSVPVLLRSIGGAVLFAIFFAVLNTMLMAARASRREAGIIKALGFTDGFVLRVAAIESVLLCFLGGVAGVLISTGITPVLAKAFASFVPGISVRTETIVFGFALAIGLGLLAGIVPAWQNSRVRPVDVMRAVG